MPVSRRVLAPAKINLYLKVLGRRADGYHELDSVMARLALADVLEAEIGGAGDSLRVTSNIGELPPDFDGPGNLVFRAASAFRAAAKGWPQAGVALRLEKNIPLGAGLGGGSSDCAAILRFLNDAAPEPLSCEALLCIAKSLGADVPFFLQPRPLARARGIGEKLGDAPPVFQPWAGRKITLVNPGVFVATGEVFKILGLTNPLPNTNLGPLPFGGPEENLGPLPFGEAGENDLLAPATKLAPALALAAESITALNPAHWGLSGSGATFWLASNAPERDAAKLSGNHPSWWICNTAIMAAG